MDEYDETGLRVGFVTLIGVFALTYAYCIAAMGPFYGILLGWVPAAIAGNIAGEVARFAWPLLGAALLAVLALAAVALTFIAFAVISNI